MQAKAIRSNIPGCRLSTCASMVLRCRSLNAENAVVTQVAEWVARMLVKT